MTLAVYTMYFLLGLQCFVGKYLHTALKKMHPSSRRSKIALLAHFLMEWHHFCCQPRLNINRRLMLCTIIDSIRFKRWFHTLKLFLLHRKNDDDDDERILFFIAYHTTP